ncbi:B-cell receptor CD22-like [Pelodiscus sinensis]|uniref:B-cell receptor CD22-like n=1 Tax=Pelodiscus sinensis TaxID=13735 RepID=UPI003F6ACA23
MPLRNIMAEHAGEYWCKVVNEIGQSQSPPINITVQWVHVVAVPRTILREGESVALRCDHSSILPAPISYAWYWNGKKLEGPRQELLLESITAEQAGEYRCQVTNGIGQSQSPPITITVQWVRVVAAPRTALQDGDSVILRCDHSSSLPAPISYAWYWNGKKLEGSRQELLLKSITAEQAGEYRCQVANGIGQSQSPPITITVQCGGECQCLSPGLMACIVLTVLLLLLVNVGACYLLQRGRRRRGAEAAAGGGVELSCRPIIDSPYEELQGPTEDLYSQLDSPSAGSRSALPLPQLPGTPQHGQDLKPKEGTSLSGAAPPAGVNGP